MSLRDSEEDQEIQVIEDNVENPSSTDDDNDLDVDPQNIPSQRNYKVRSSLVSAFPVFFLYHIIGFQA
jgi:hypothetical protein